MLSISKTFSTLEGGQFVGWFYIFTTPATAQALADKFIVNLQGLDFIRVIPIWTASRDFNAIINE